VKASNSDGVFSRNVATITFYIAKPFWTRWWFRITMILFFAGIITAIIYWRVRNVISEEQEKLKISGMVGELELKALRAQMNPHFIFNSLNSIQDFVLNHQGTEAAKYLSKFARLVRMILDNSEYTFISISQKIEFLRLYIELESLRMDNGFEFHLSLDKSVNLEDQIPTMVIQPYVENAIWHGLQYKKSHRLLKLHLSMEDEDFVRCEIEDNGIGREAAMQIKKQKGKTHDSKAMKITDERIQILKKLYGFGPSVEIIDLVDEGIARGTMVILKLPIHHG
jgi:LytS/YehU family sensor histidine kinase